MTAWNDWFHVNGNTYGTWLPGDPRGWREKRHKKHVEGDYKSPPPPGQDAALLHHVRGRLTQPPVHLDVDQRRIGGQAAVGKLVHQGVEVLAFSLDAVHLHILAASAMGRSARSWDARRSTPTMSFGVRGTRARCGPGAVAPSPSATAGIR